MSTTASLTKMIASGVDLARDLVGAPPNSKTPLAIAQLAKDMAAASGLECQVLGEKECQEKGMGGYLGVQQVYFPEYMMAYLACV
jgi:leucyl aminopeptidase